MSFSAKEVLVIDMANQSNNQPSTTTFSLNEIDLLELGRRIKVLENAHILNCKAIEVLKEQTNENRKAWKEMSDQTAANTEKGNKDYILASLKCE